MNAVLRRLDALVGEWDVSVIVEGETLGAGRTTFTWSDDESFLLQHHVATNLDSVPPESRDNAPTSVNTVIGLDDGTETFCQLYADSRGVFRIYQLRLDNGHWEIWRDNPGFSQRFTADFSDDGRTINGRWEKSEDGADWTLDFHLTYSKVG